MILGVLEAVGSKRMDLLESMAAATVLRELVALGFVTEGEGFKLTEKGLEALKCLLRIA